MTWTDEDHHQPREEEDYGAVNNKSHSTGPKDTVPRGHRCSWYEDISQNLHKLSFRKSATSSKDSGYCNRYTNPPIVTFDMDNGTGFILCAAVGRWQSTATIFHWHTSLILQKPAFWTAAPCKRRATGHVSTRVTNNWVGGE